MRAPELHGQGGWIGTGGAELSLAALRGRFVLFDFWTLCCANCLHVIEELRPLEAEFAVELIVIGVHSPKFAHETEHAAVEAAVERYGVHHPVLDDPELATWRQYAVRAWPTLVLVDPEGYIVAHLSGEGHVGGIAAMLRELVAEHEQRGTLSRGDGPYVPTPPAPGALRFPAGLAALPDGGWLVADTGHHQVVELAADLATERRRYGSGDRGLADGPAGAACFAEPEGLCLLPPEVAEQVGYDVLVADTANHCLRAVDRRSGQVRTVAGDGGQWMQGDGTARLSTPWDLVWWPHLDRVVIAMAGIHQLWSFDPRTGELAVIAGTTHEGLRDGAAGAAWLAQPSGLAVAGTRLWFVDSEASALRWLEDGEVGTAVGEGLFDFGHVDGPAPTARLQHPLGVLALPDGSVAVADTYNGAIRRYDPVAGAVSTVAEGLSEPVALALDAPYLLVSENAAHRLTRVGLDAELHRDAGALQTQRPVTELGAGVVRVEVPFEPPPGEALDERWGPATRLVVSASPAELLLAGGGAAPGLAREITLAPGEGVLHVAATAASCDKEGEHPACHVHQQDWGVPVRVVAAGGEQTVTLPLRAVDESAGLPAG